MTERKINKSFNALKPFAKRLKTFFQRTGSYIKENLAPGKRTKKIAASAIYAGLALALILSAMVYLPALGWTPVLIAIAALATAAFVISVLTILLIRLLAKVHFWIAASLLAGIPVMMIFFHLNWPGSLMVLFYIAICCSFIGGSLALFGKKWAKRKMLHRILSITTFSTGLLAIAGGLFWLLHPGKIHEMPPNAAMSIENLPPALSLEDPSARGTYTVGYLTYGSGTDIRRREFGEEATLITEPVDGTTFLGSWEGMGGRSRTRYFGFDASELPLNARVWYPEGEGPFPLVLIVHGNHLAQNFSDPGYAYLGELLASRGYIMASIDQNFLNGSYTDFPKGLNNENDARGWLLLKHLKAWEAWNLEEDNPFYNKVDMDNLALIGHSRGGEAVGHAALFNRLPYYPDDANEKFDFNFHIRSIVSIAPVDGQYQPANIRTPLSDINFLVLQGSHDADLSSYLGLRLFNRLQFSEDFEGFKAGVYIWNANHGQFNSVWGRTDFPGPRINFFNLAQLISEEEQQQIAKVYISAFLEATLKEKQDYRPMFKDHRKARHWLPETIYISHYGQSGETMICSYQEDLDLSTGTLPQSTISTTDLSIWREQELPLIWGNHDSRGVILGWNTTESDTLHPEYTITWPAGTLQITEISQIFFSIAPMNERACPPNGEDDENGEHDENGDDEAEPDERAEEDDPSQEGDDNGDEEEEKFIDFTIRFTDANGHEIAIPLSTFSPVQPRLKRRFTKLAFMQRVAEDELIPQYIYFSLARLASLNPEFSFDLLCSISFCFDLSEEGVIALNNLGINSK